MTTSVFDLSELVHEMEYQTKQHQIPIQKCFVIYSFY